MSLCQQLRVTQDLHPSVMLTLKPNKGKCAELFCLQMSLCHVLGGGKGAALALICRMVRAAMPAPKGGWGILQGTVSHAAKSSGSQAQRRCTGTLKGDKLQVFAGDWCYLSIICLFAKSCLFQQQMSKHLEFSIVLLTKSKCKRVILVLLLMKCTQELLKLH